MLHFSFILYAMLTFSNYKGQQIIVTNRKKHCS
jgi:hypothetical protein